MQILDIQSLLEEKAHNAESLVGILNLVSNASVTVNDNGSIELTTKDGMSFRICPSDGTTYLTSPLTKIQSSLLSLGVPGGVFLTMDNDDFVVESENSKISLSGNQAEINVNGAEFSCVDDVVKMSTKDGMGISFSQDGVIIAGPNGSNIVMRYDKEKGSVIDFNCDVAPASGNIGDITLINDTGDVLLDISKLSDKMVGLDHELQIADKAVTENKIANSAVKSEHIEDRAVTGDKIALKTISSSHVKDGSISEIKLLNGSITETKLNFQTHILY